VVVDGFLDVFVGDAGGDFVAGVGVLLVQLVEDEFHEGTARDLDLTFALLRNIVLVFTLNLSSELFSELRDQLPKHMDLFFALFG
jgi:hypothetical protein